MLKGTISAPIAELRPGATQITNQLPDTISVATADHREALHATIDHVCFIVAAFALASFATHALLSEATAFEAVAQYLISSIPNWLAASFGLLAIEIWALAIWAIFVCWKDRPSGSLISHLIGKARASFLVTAGLPFALALHIAFSINMITFSDMKAAIPQIAEFGWDLLFIQVDRLLHGGDPWALMQPLLGFPALTIVIDQLYYVWFPVMFGTLAWQIFDIRRSQLVLRHRFLVSFLACWIFVGCLAAIGFSSAGPIFQELLGNTYSFGGLNPYLQQVNEISALKSLAVRDQLWVAYDQGLTDTPMKGISAMPSMHNAICMLLVLLGFKKDKRLGMAYLAYGLVIFLGSVHLGWHYAIDAYLAFAMVAVIWFVSGQIVPANVKKVANSAGPEWLTSTQK